MKYTVLEFLEDWGYGTDIDVDFQKLYDFVKSENYSGVPLETDLDVLEEFKKYNRDYIEECYIIHLCSYTEEYNNNVIDNITKDFAEWINEN